MNESKIRGLKWNLKKFKGLILHFNLLFLLHNTNPNYYSVGI